MHDVLKQFEQLLSTGRLGEAKAMLSSLCADVFSKDEENRAKVLRARLSIKLQNAINSAYLAKLDTSLAELRKLNASARALDEAVRLAHTRASLK